MSGWGNKFETVVESWDGGTRTAARGDLIPENTSPLVYNGSWERIGDDTAIVEKRPGFSLINGGTALPSAIEGQYFYDRRSTSGTYTTYHLLALSDGTLRKIDDSAGTITDYGTAGFTSSISGKFVSGVTAANSAYMVAETATTAGGVAGNGLKFNGTDWTVMGITAPVTPTVTGLVAGSMTGTFDVAISFYNSDTGHQSSRCDETSITVTGKQLLVEWVPSADAQVTHVNVHLRDQTISTGFYEATSVAVGSASVSLNVDTTDYNALTTIAPDQFENNPVPEGTRFLTWHKSRVFAATSSYLYYSKIEFPESFDPERFEPVNTDDGQQIMGMIPAFNNLVVFKERSFYALVGDGPNDWRLEQISTKVGLAASGSIVSVDGLLYWWANDGPVVWDGVNEPKRIGKTLIGETLTSSKLNTTRLAQIEAIEDRQNERIMWAVPEAGSTENSLILPFKYRLGQFEGIWTGLHVASWGRGEYTDGFEWCYLGSYGGRVYRFGDSDFDGLPFGQEYTGTFTPLSTSISTIDGTGFDIVTGYADMHVVVIEEESGAFVDKVEISSNTATEVTLVNTVNGLDLSKEYRFYIGGIDFQFDTRWQNDALPIYKKRYEFLFLQAEVDKPSDLYVGFSFNWDATQEIERVLALTPYGGSSQTIPLWDEAVWDASVWAAQTPTDEKLRIARAAKTWRLRLVQTEPGVTFSLYKVGIRGEYLTTKR